MKQFSHCSPSRRVSPLTKYLALSLGLAVSAMSAHAATQTWTGATSTDFELGGNWSVSAPTNDLVTDTALFTGAVTSNQPALTASRSITGLTFDTATGGWTLSGSPFILGIGASGITSANTSGTNTISANVDLGAAQSWNVSTGGTLAVSGAITGVAGNNLTKTGAGVLVLSGSNTLSGTTSISAGTLEYQGSSSMSSSSALSMSNGSTLSLRADADTTFTAASLSGFGTNGTSRSIQVNSLNSPAGNGHTLTMSGVLSGTTGSSASPVTVNVSSTTGDTLRFGSTFTLNGTGSGAWAADRVAFNLTNADMVLNGLAQTGLNGGITLDSTTGNSLTITGNVSTVGSRTVYAQVNSGVLNLNNTSSNSGGANYGFFVYLNGGSLNVNNASAIRNNSAISGSRAGLAIAGGTLNNTSGAAITLTYNPTILLNGDFAFSTAAGTSANSLNLGTGAASLGPAAGTTRTITTNGSATLTVSGSISNGTTATSLTKAGTGTLVLGGSNAYTGTTTVNNGTLVTAKAFSLPGYNSPGKVVFNGGTVGVQVGGAGWATSEVDTLLSNATLTSGALGIDTTNGSLSQWTPFGSANLGSLGIAKLGSNTLTLDQANTYTGVTSINGGTLNAGMADVAGVSGALGNGGNITFGGGTLQFSAASASTDYSARIKNSASAISIDTNGQSATFAGGLDSSNTGGLTKLGTGTLTLSGSNSYGASTTVGAGALVATNSNALGAGGVTINSGATLDLQASIANVVTVSGTGVGGNGALVNNGASLATLTGVKNSGGFTIGGSGDISLNFATGNSLTKVGTGTVRLLGGGVASNTVTVNAGTVILSATGNNASMTGNLVLNSGTVKMDPTAQSTNSASWSGQVGNEILINGGVWDLNDTTGVNNRSKRVTGSAGTITNSGTATALLAFGFRDHTNGNFSGTITDGPNGGKVAIQGDNSAGSDGGQILAGDNSYSGGTVLNSGTFIMGHNNAFGVGTVSSKSLIDLAGFSMGNALVSPGNGAVFTNSSANTAAVTGGFNAAHSNNVTISDFTITGTAGAINWTGDIYRSNFTGTITKSGANTVTFGGLVNNMGLNVSGGAAIISGTIGGSVAITGSTGTTLTVSGKLDGTDTTTVNGAASFLNGSTYKFDISTNGVNDKITGAGTVSLAGTFAFELSAANKTIGNVWQIVNTSSGLVPTYDAAFNVAGFTESNNVWTMDSIDGQWQFSEGTGQLTLVVPEASTFAMLIAGAASLVAFRRRRS